MRESRQTDADAIVRWVEEHFDGHLARLDEMFDLTGWQKVVLYALGHSHAHRDEPPRESEPQKSSLAGYTFSNIVFDDL